MNRRVAVLAILLSAATFVRGAGRELAPPPQGPTPYAVSNPDIAWAGGKFLTVWRELRGQYGGFVMGTFSDAGGNPLGPSFVVLREVPAWMDLVSTGDGFVLFRSGPLVGVEIIDIDLSGRITGARRISESWVQAQVAWNGTHFLFFMPSNTIAGDAHAALFTRNGEVVRRHIPLTNGPAFIVPDGDEFVVLSAGRDGLYAGRVTPAGAAPRALVEEGHGFISGAYRPTRAVGVARGDGSILAVWSGSDWRGTQVKAAILGPDGRPGEVRLIAEGDLAGDPLSLVRVPGGYIATVARRHSDGLYRLVPLKLDESGRVAESGESYVVGDREPVAAAGEGVTGIIYTPPSEEWQRIFHRVIDVNRQLSGQTILSTARARQRQPVLGAGGGQFLAAFTEVGATPWTRAAAAAPDGEPLGNQYVGELALVGNELAWNGNSYLPILQRRFELFAQRVTFDGTPIGEPVLLGELNESADTPASVVWSVDRWFVVWLEETEAFFATVSPAGIVSAAQPLPIEGTFTDDDRRVYVDVALAADGPRVLVTWIEGAGSELPRHALNPQAYAQRFRRDGRPIDPAPLALAESVRGISATSGTGFAVVTSGYYASKITLLDSNAPALGVLAAHDFGGGLSDVTWDGREYVVATRFSQPQPRDLTVTRFDERLGQTGPARMVFTLRADEDAKPSIAVVSGEAIVAVQEGEPENGARAVVYRERDMTPMDGSPRRRAIGR